MSPADNSGTNRGRGRPKGQKNAQGHRAGRPVGSAYVVPTRQQRTVWKGTDPQSVSSTRAIHPFFQPQQPQQDENHNEVFYDAVEESTMGNGQHPTVEDVPMQLTENESLVSDENHVWASVSTSTSSMGRQDTIMPMAAQLEDVISELQQNEVDGWPTPASIDGDDIDQGAFLQRLHTKYMTALS